MGWIYFWDDELFLVKASWSDLERLVDSSWLGHSFSLALHLLHLAIGVTWWGLVDAPLALRARVRTEFHLDLRPCVVWLLKLWGILLRNTKISLRLIHTVVHSLVHQSRLVWAKLLWNVALLEPVHLIPSSILLCDCLLGLDELFCIINWPQDVIVSILLSFSFLGVLPVQGREVAVATGWVGFLIGVLAIVQRRWSVVGEVLLLEILIGRTSLLLYSLRLLSGKPESS